MVALHLSYEQRGRFINIPNNAITISCALKTYNYHIRSSIVVYGHIICATPSGTARWCTNAISLIKCTHSYQVVFILFKRYTNNIYLNVEFMHMVGYHYQLMHFIS